MPKRAFCTYASILIAALLGMAVVTPARAEPRDWPDTAGWKIIEGDDFCVMTTDYEGPGESTLTVAMYTSGQTLITDTNRNWTSKVGEKYDDVSFSLDGKVYEGQVNGFALLGKNGFAAKMDQALLADFAAAATLRISKEEVLIDRLELSGSAAALGVVRRCVGTIRAREAAAARTDKAARAAEAQYDDIKRDPFAKPEA